MIVLSDTQPIHTIAVNGEALAELLRQPAYGSVKWERGGAVQGKLHLFGRSTSCPTFMVSMIGVPDRLHTLQVTVVLGASRAMNVAATRLAAAVLAWVECGGDRTDALEAEENDGMGQPIVDWLTEVVKGVTLTRESKAATRFGERNYTAEYCPVPTMGGGSLTISIESAQG